MNTDEKVELVGKAARVVKALEEQHTKLMTQVPRWRPYPEIGTLGVEGGEVTATCLGVKLAVTRRPVLAQGLGRMEYVFSVIEGDKRTPIWAMYLGANTILYVGPGQTEELCHASNDDYGQQLVLSEIGTALLASHVFKALPNLNVQRQA